MVSKTALIAIIVSVIVVSSTAVGIGIYFATHTKMTVPGSTNDSDDKPKEKMRPICRDSVEKGATINKSGIIDATFYDSNTNTCVTQCDSTGEGDPATCNAICKSKGYDRYFVKDATGRCVRKLDCANKITTATDCGQNSLCKNNESVLPKLKVPLEDDTEDWKCVTSEDALTWSNACSKAGGTWLIDTNYCWISNPGIVSYSIVSSKEATLVIDVMVESSALQNNINIANDLIWSIVLVEESTSSQYEYKSPLVGAASPGGACDTSSGPCQLAGITTFVLSEGNSPKLPATFTLKLQALLKTNSDIVVAKSNTGKPVTVESELGSFDAPLLDKDKAEVIVKNIASFEGLIKKGVPVVSDQLSEDEDSGVLVPNADVKKLLESDGVPYEVTSDAILVPCTMAFCKSEKSFSRKFVVIAWKPISDTVVTAALGKTPCKGLTPDQIDIWYWLGLVNARNPSQVSQKYLVKGADEPYFMASAITGTTVTYKLAALLIAKGKPPPDLSDGLGRAVCRSKIQTIQVEVTEYTDASCRRFRPQQVVGSIIGSSVPVPDYAWAEDGRCVWGPGATNYTQYRDYACLYKDSEFGTISPQTPNSKEFQLYNENIEKCDTVIAKEGGNKTPRYPKIVCNDTDLQNACTTGSSLGGTINYTCSNDLGFNDSSISIDLQTFNKRCSSAEQIAMPASVDSGNFATNAKRKKVYDDMIRNACQPLSDNSCVDDNGFLTSDCSSSWATKSCDVGDTNCKDILDSGGVYDCKDTNCVSNVLSPWNCKISGQQWNCTQNREKCFAYDPGPLPTDLNTVCCSGRGYIVEEPENHFRCFGSKEYSPNGKQCIDSDGYAWGSLDGIWPQCNVQNYPICGEDYQLDKTRKKCISSAISCSDKRDNDGNLSYTYDESKHACVLTASTCTNSETYDQTHNACVSTASTCNSGPGGTQTYVPLPVPQSLTKFNVTGNKCYNTSLLCDTNPQQGGTQIYDPKQNQCVTTSKEYCEGLGKWFNQAANRCDPITSCNQYLQSYDSDTNTCTPKKCGSEDCCDGDSTSCQGEACAVNCYAKNLSGATWAKQKSENKLGFQNCKANCDLEDDFQTCDARRWAPLPVCEGNFCATHFPCDTWCEPGAHLPRPASGFGSGPDCCNSSGTTSDCPGV